MKMSEKRALAMEYLEKFRGTYISPTEIGEMVFDKPYDTASSFASPILRDLCASSDVERSPSGKYRLPIN